MRNNIIATTTEAAAYADGSKTAFIELVRPQPKPSDVIMIGGTDTYAVFKKGDVFPYKGPFLLNHTIYIREAFGYILHDKSGPLYDSIFFKAEDVCNDWQGSWIPSSRMSKSAARTWLLITDIKCKRVQDLSEEDAKMLGIEPFIYNLDKSKSYLMAFKILFADKYSIEYFDSNPYIFLYTCKKVDKP